MENDIPSLQAAWKEKINDLTGGAPMELPPFQTINHSILLINETKRLHPWYAKCPDILHPELMEKLERYIKTGWWEERNVSQASLMLCIYKKSGCLRTVIDCCERNLNTVKDLTPFPDQDLIRNDVAQVKYCSKLDMSDAYD
jgi:hypothetical protein